MRVHAVQKTRAVQAAIRALFSIVLVAAALLLFLTGTSQLDVSAAGSNVIDNAGLLSQTEAEDLDAYAQSITNQYQVGVYIVTVPWHEGEVDDAADELYHVTYGLGVGEDRDGIMLMLSMEDRDYAILTNGEAAKYAFSDYATGELEETFLPDLAEDEWKAAFQHYLEACDEYLALAAAGDPVSEPIWGALLLIVLVSCVISILICLVLRKKSKSVHVGTQAIAYTTGKLHLTDHYDKYTHTSRVEHKIPKSTSSGGSSVSTTSHGSSVRSGKF